MDHYRIVAVFIVFFLPYLFKKLLGADDLSPVFTEDPENIKLDGCQCQLSFIIDAFMRIAVQEKTAEINDVFLRTVSFVVFGRPPELGFERCVMYLTGMGNIRDVLPFPRTVGTCEL